MTMKLRRKVMLVLLLALSLSPVATGAPPTDDHDLTWCPRPGGCP